MAKLDVERLACDNKKNFRLLLRLVRDGVELNGVLQNRDSIPSIHICDDDKKVFLWMFPALEQFVLRYLLSGDNRNYPVYPPNDKLPDFRAGDDYIDRHIKRELKRGKYTYNKETQDGITGIRFIGQYPYGSIDYGFHAGTWEEFTARLESIEPFVYIGYDENDIPERHYNTLPIEYRYLEVERAKLDTVFPDRFIPTNTIIDKTICGSGATWLEIHSQRNSIIIEPNVPVIISKEQKHQHIIGIYGEDNEVQDIVERIEEQTGYVKIMTTPDSYWKVRDALKSLRVPYLIDFFLLFDECEKMVSEIDFRPKINLPIDDFFKFKGKAMVSATPIVMSDPRFEKQRFKVIKILPKFDHKLLLELKPTNNVTITVKRTVETVDKDATVCIFYNSVEGIEDLIAFLDISDQSNIYCSTAASKKLHRRKYSNVFDSVTDENGHTALNKYNFFTSRFYSAVDIEVANKPIVIMITQVYKAAPKVVHPNTPFIIRQQAELKHTPYTFIDPETEAIQIAGRFRNGIDRLIHITNTSYDLGYRVRAVMEQFLKEQHSGFHKMLELERSVEQYGEKWIIRDALQSTEYWKEGYINGENLEINFFRYDNAYLDERLKMLYNFPASLYKAYKRSGAFDIVSKSENVIYTDEEKQKLENASKAKIAKLLVEIMNRDADSDDPYNEQLRQGLKCDFPLMVEAINVIGYARMKALRFRDSALEAEIARVKSENKAQSDKVKLAIYKTFKENTWYPAAYINENIHRIFTDNGAECNRQGLGGHLALYFRVEEKRQSRGARGWMIHEKLDV